MYQYQLWIKGQLVPSVQIKEAVLQLLSWLQQFENIVICAHNGRQFHFPILLPVLKKLGEFPSSLTKTVILWIL
jgi:uncharacterized protein YprB with RNaseH-like and TPR domain